MRKKLREIPKRTLTMFLAAAVVFTTVIGSANLSGVLARANEITQADGDYDTYNTTVYEALDAEEMAAYLLDEYPTLTLELDGEDTELKVKAWESEDYNPEAAGTYTFTPVFKKSAVSAAENVELPSITVVLEKNTIREITADLSTITVTASEDLSISDLGLPEEIEVVLDLRTQEEYEADAAAAEEAGKAEAEPGKEDLAVTTLEVEEWTCTGFDGSTAGAYVFTPDFGNDFEDQYEWDTSLDEVSLNVCVEETETSDTADTSGDAADTGTGDSTDTGSDNADAADTSGSDDSSENADGTDDDTSVTYDATLEAASVSDAAAAVAETDDEEEEEGAVTAIESLTVTLVSGATLNDDGDYVWTATTNSAGHKFKFRVTYQTSGTGYVSAGEYVFRIPASILTDKDGDAADVVSMSYPSSDELESMTDAQKEAATGFAYYIDENTNEIVIYNFKEITAAQTGYFEVSYATSEKTQNYYDYGYESEDDGDDTTDDGDGTNDSLIGTFYAMLTSGDVSRTSDGIDVYIDTSVEISSTSKGYPTKYTSWQSTWGTKPNDIDAAYYLVYTITTKIDSDLTQTYDFTLTDNTVTYTATYSDGSSVSGSLSDTDSGVSIVAYRLQGGSYQTVDADGLDSTTSDGISVTATGLSGTTRYDYVVIALSSSVFENAVSFTVNNTETATVTPSDGVDEATSKTSSKSFSWTKPEWVIPSGSFNIWKYGNENGNFGSYINYSLDTLQSEDATSETSIENIKYRIVMAGYAYPYTLRSDWETAEGYSYTNSSGKVIPKYNAYGQNSVTYVVTDDTVYPLNADGTDVNGNDLSNATGEQSLDDYGDISAYADTEPLESADYDFSYVTYSVSMTDAVRDDNGEPTVDEEYNLIKQSVKADTDIITLYVKVNVDEAETWLTAGTYNLGTSTWTADTGESSGSSYVSSMTSSQITFDTGVDGYRLELTNNYYYTGITAYAYITLYATENVQEWIGTDANDDAQDVVILRNAVTLDVYYESEYEEDGENADTIVSIAKVIGDRLRRTERDSYITKKASMTASSSVDQTYTVTWTISAYETITTGDSDTDYLPQEGGTFYDLLPYGSTYETGSVLVRTEDGYLDETEYTVTVTDNYGGSGRTLLTVQIDVTADYFYLYFNTLYSWESITDNGMEVVNPVAYETGNDSITDGYADDAGGLDDTDDNNVYMADLDPDTDAKRFIYSAASVTLDTEVSAVTGLTKKVRASSDTTYSYDTTVVLGGTYSYRLRYANSYTAQTTDMILYDSLENYQEGEWKGTLTAVDTSQLTEMGIAAKVYISTVSGLDLTTYSEESIPDLSDTSVWTLVTADTDLSAATAVAIDMSEDEEGNDYVLDYGESVAVVLYMEAPETDTSETTDSYPETYNNVYMSGTTVTTTGAETDYYIHHDYTTVRYAITGDVLLKKVDENDNEETISGITFVLSGISDYGTEVYVEKTTNSSGVISWTDIEKGTYTLQEIGEYDDWLADHEEITVVIDGSGGVTIGDTDYTGTYYVFGNAPRVHADIEFTKTDELSGYALGGGFTFRLYGTSDYGNTVNEYANSSSSGKVTFSNIEKGTYTLVETKADDDHIYEEIEYTVRVDEDGNVSITLDGESVSQSKSGTYLISNMPYQTLTILKRSSYDNSAISGVEFTLSGTSDLGTSYSQVQETDSNGSLTFTDLEPGTYTLIETSIENVPEGTTVAADDTVRVVVVYDDGTITIDEEELNSYHNYTIVNTEVASDTISVIKKWVTENVSALYDDDGDPIFPTIYLSTEEPATYVDVTLNLGDSEDVGTGSITISGTSYSNGATISVKYGSTLSSLLGSATPTYTSGTFLAWYADSSLTETYDTSSVITKDVTVYASVRKNALYYAVSVYGIMEDTYSSDGGTTTGTAGLTFGPASGYSYVSQYASHTPSGNTEEGARDTASTTIDGEYVSTTQGQTNAHRCIHDDSWEMIIWWSEHNPYVYEQCMTGGTNSSTDETEVSCTKAVEITLNDTLANSTYVTDDSTSSYYSYTHMSGDGADALYYVINSNYRMWNGYKSSGSYYSYGGWGTSQIRQVLNGSDTAGYSTYQSCWYDSSGTAFTEITESTSLLSCFPSDLQSAIVSTQITYNSHTGTSSSAQTSATCYDKLFLMSTRDVWDYEVSCEPDTTQYERNSSLSITTSNPSKAKLFSESGSGVASWLRSVDYYGSGNACNVGSTGSCHYRRVYGTYGLSPCFCLK